MNVIEILFLSLIVAMLSELLDLVTEVLKVSYNKRSLGFKILKMLRNQKGSWVRDIELFWATNSGLEKDEFNEKLVRLARKGKIEMDEDLQTYCYPDGKLCWSRYRLRIPSD